MVVADMQIQLSTTARSERSCHLSPFHLRSTLLLLLRAYATMRLAVLGNVDFYVQGFEAITQVLPKMQETWLGWRDIDFTAFWQKISCVYKIWFGRGLRGRNLYSTTLSKCFSNYIIIYSIGCNIEISSCFDQFVLANGGWWFLSPFFMPCVLETWRRDLGSHRSLYPFPVVQICCPADARWFTSFLKSWWWNIAPVWQPDSLILKGAHLTKRAMIFVFLHRLKDCLSRCNQK